MEDEKLKILLAVLSGIVFGLIFILLAFILPIDVQEQKSHHSKPTHTEKPSH